MLFQRFMTGRGNLGYGFRAQTSKVPITPFMKLRAADTGDTNRFLLEILTTKYHQIAVAGSCFDREQSNGYTDILFADPNGGKEWQDILDNPGLLLYLPHISKADFLETSNKGKAVALGVGVEMGIPKVTHNYDQRFHVDEDVLTDLVADVWYAASMRLTASERPGDWPSVNICLTEEAERDDTLDIGREFYCNVLMPALPRALRSIVSVSIGGRYGDVSNATNGGAAAVLITLPDEKNELLPGTYVLTSSSTRHQSLNPFQDTKGWHNFGRAVLKYAKAGIAGTENEEAYLNDFFAVAELINSKEEYQELRYLTANWPYAFLLFNGHMGCEAALQRIGEFDDSVSLEDIQATFEENIWESADTALLTELGFPEKEARNCYVWLEQHMLDAMRGNTRIQVTQERYVELARRAFTLDQVEKEAHRQALQQKYDELLLCGTAQDDNNAFEMLLELMAYPEFNALFSSQRMRLASLMERALEVYDAIPSDEYMMILAEYAKRGDEERNLVTEYAMDLLERNVEYSRLKVFRSVQRGDVLDHAVVESFREDAKVQQCMEAEFRADINRYAQAAPAACAMPEAKIKAALADVISGYVKENTYAYRNQLEQVNRAFDDIGMEKSTVAMDTLTECLRNEEQPFCDADVPYAVAVLGAEDPACAERMLGTLSELFEKALPDMFEQGRRTVSTTHMVLDRCWCDCVRLAAGDMREKLQNQLAECTRDYVTQERESMRYQMPNVVQAFKDLGLDNGRSNEAQALCECMEVTGEAFTEQDANVVLPVLRSAEPEAQRMAAAVLKTFTDSVPLMVKEESNPEDYPWKKCIREKKPSEAQQQLAQDMRECLWQYADQKPEALVSRLGRLMDLFKAYGCTDAEQTTAICCKVFKSQTKKLDEEAILNEQDVKVVHGLDLKNVSDTGKEALAEVLHELYVKKLPVMGKDGEVCARWCSCLKNKYLGELLKAKSQQTFAEYVDKCNADVRGEAAEDRLSEFLNVVDSLEWQRVDAVRKAIAGYFAKLERAALQANEIQVLLNMRGGLNREIDMGLCDVFSRAMPRLLKDEEEVQDWIPVATNVDLQEPFQKAVQQLRAEARTEQNSLGEAFILSLIRLGNTLESLRPAAVEQAISIIEENKNAAAATNRVAFRLMSTEEHNEVLSAVIACKSQPLLHNYIDLLAYVPVDAENTDNEKLLRKEMKSMRETLFTCMDADAASYAARTHEVWKGEIQQALLERLEQLTSMEGLTFQQLCALPQRWAVECRDWQFVSFTELTRYVPDRSQLENAAKPGAWNVISRSRLTEFKENPLREDENWYASLLNSLVAQRAGRNVGMLIEECETPKAVEDLLNVLHETKAEVSSETAQVLNMVLYGQNNEGVLSTYQQLHELGPDAMNVGASLLRKAVFGRQSGQWKEKWNVDNCSGRIPMAALCYLGTQSKDWEAFFEEVLQNTSMDKKALAAGTDPVQALMFASSVLKEMGMNTEAEEMTEKLKTFCKEEYAYVRAVGRKRRELSALRDTAAWKTTGAAESLYQLIFNKH